MFNRILIGAMNVALRRGGARNVFAFDAATHFKAHFNMPPTTVNITGCGEAPFRSLGIPVRNQRLVRFFCPAWVSPPKHRSVETGKAMSQSHLGMRKLRCFIVGYGSGMYEGNDTDGYKVVVAATGDIYSSLHVTPTPDMEVSKSFLTGLRHDPLNEGILIKRIFDVDGKESLEREPSFDDDCDSQKKSGQKEDPPQTDVAAAGRTNSSDDDVEDTGENGDPSLCDEDLKHAAAGTSLPPKRRQEGSRKGTQKAHVGGSPSSKGRKMTVGTGATGQMRWEMEAHNEKITSNDIMNRGEAHDAIRIARRAGATFNWKTPSEAKKRGDSRKRYEIYCKIKTFVDYDRVRSRAKDMRSGDLVNDVMKGHVSFVPNAEINTDEDVMVAFNDDYEMDEDSILLATVADGSVEIAMDDSVQLGAKDHYLETVKTRFFDAIVQEARAELGLEVVPDWVALGVFHHAEIWVEGRKQPGGLKEAMRLPEWPEWREAIRKEILGLIEIGVWAEIPREQVPAGVKVLPGKMILEIKTEDGKFKKCKARYVSRGDLATRGEHYWETSSHQVRAKSFRMFFATAVVDYAKKKGAVLCPT